MYACASWTCTHVQAPMHFNSNYGFLLVIMGGWMDVCMCVCVCVCMYVCVYACASWTCTHVQAPMHFNSNYGFVLVIMGIYW